MFKQPEITIAIIIIMACITVVVTTQVVNWLIRRQRRRFDIESYNNGVCPNCGQRWIQEYPVKYRPDLIHLTCPNNTLGYGNGTCDMFYCLIKKGNADILTNEHRIRRDGSIIIGEKK